MIQILISLSLLVVFAWLIPEAGKLLQEITRKFGNIIKRSKSANIFESRYLEVKSFYMREFRVVPSISFINNVDTGKIFEYVNKGFAGDVLAIYQRNYYCWQRGRQEFGTTIFKLKDQVMIEIGSEYAEILFKSSRFEYANELVQIFSTYKATEKEEDFEINIITMNNGSLELKYLEIKPTVLDIDLYYNDDFKPIDELIRERLGKEKDKGIILLHGLPGTGKTTYLRHLIGSIKKKVLFVSPGVAANLMNPEFMDLLIDNPDSVLIIEDAENVIMDRKFSSYSGVSNLLNISDGLLSDCLNVQIICTFNSDVNLVDEALLRKGRLIARYEFSKLDVAKAQRLSDHLELHQDIKVPMTIAEITNPSAVGFSRPAVQVIGFRRPEIAMN